MQKLAKRDEISDIVFVGLKWAKNLFAFSTMLCKRLFCVFCYSYLKVKLFSKKFLQSFRDKVFGVADFGGRNSFRMTSF